MITDVVKDNDGIFSVEAVAQPHRVTVASWEVENSKLPLFPRQSLNQN